MGKFIKYGSFKSFVKSVNENENSDYDVEDLGYDPVEISRRINKAIIWMNIRKADYADLLANVDIYGSDEIRPETMCTDGRRIIFHPKFVASQTDEAIRLVLAHELLHCIGDHMTRRQERNPLIWNFACDYAINPILDGEEGFEWPKNEDGSRMGLLEDKYAGMRAEDIYELIKDLPPPKDEQDLGNVVDEGTPLPDPSPGLEIQMDDEEENGEDDNGEGEDEEDTEGDGGGGPDGEGEDKDSEDGSGSGGSGGDSEYEVYQAQVGDLIKTKDGKYGKITSMNSDGTYDIESMTENDVKTQLGIGKSSSTIPMDAADVNEL